MRCSRETFVTFRCRRRDERAQALPQSRPIVKGPVECMRREASVKIRVILVMSLVALSSSAASAERLFSPRLGEISPPRPPREIGTSTSHQPDLPAAVPVDQPEQKPNAATAPVNRPEQAPTKQPEQKRAAAPVLSKPGVVTIGPSAAAPRPPTPGNASQAPAFPAAQTLE
jgi:hypothetical protein